MTRQRVLITTAILLLIAILALPAIPPRSQAQGDRLNVIASFSILADVVAQVAGEDAAVTSLMPVGANPHAYSPSAQDVAALSDADLVFVVGANYEEGLLPVLREAAGANVVAASQCVPIRPISGVVDPDHHAEQHDGEHNGERGHEEPVRFGAPCDTHYEAVAAAFDQDAAALLSGGGSGIGRAVAVLFAREGADVAILHLDETADAEVTRKAVEKEGREVEFKAKDELELPEELTQILKKDRKLAKAFEALTPGRRRGYVLHFSSAKQSRTRTARIEKSIPKILAGKGLQED